MKPPEVWAAAEMELMSPDERARIVAEGFQDWLEGLDPEFRTKVGEKGRRIVAEYGLLDTETS